MRQPALNCVEMMVRPHKSNNLIDVIAYIVCLCWLARLEHSLGWAVSQVSLRLLLQNGPEKAIVSRACSASCLEEHLDVNKKYIPQFSVFISYFSWHKTHKFQLANHRLSSSANMFLMSIVTTLYHSEILIWIRLCHVRGLRKWGSFFILPSLIFVPLLPVTSPCCLLTGPLMCLL